MSSVISEVDGKAWNDGGSPTVIGTGTTLNDRFLLEKELGRGGMGAVYAATDQVLQRAVAIKVLKDQQAGEEVSKRLRLEAQIAARLLHENVVRIYDFGQSEGTSYLVMEQVDGTSYVRRWREITLGERLQILAGVAVALDYAHHQGVIHRDVKPGNVLLTIADAPKLSDFGLSLLAEHDDAAGVVRGTPHYMSPEQAKGQRLNYRTDLYSLGVMLYESATGAVPFTGTPMSVMAQHTNTPPPIFRSRDLGVSPDLENLIFALLAKRPEDRPANGAIIAEALRIEADKLRPQAHAQPAAPSPAPAEPVDSPLDLRALAELGEGRTITAQPSSPGVEKVSIANRPAGAPPSPVAIADAADLVSSALVRKMLRTVLAEPIALNPEERYLYGHYLAYLLIGSRRKRFFARRKIERLNADRARLILATTYALTAHDPDAAVAEAAELLDQRIDVRSALSPAVLAKFLSWRETPARRKMLRKVRKEIHDASTYAQKHMTDDRGVLNPGLIPRSLDDLAKLAPPRSAVGDKLVERWNRLADAWRDHSDLRLAALRYASGGSNRDPSGAAMWAEVVYPLMELARAERQNRSRAREVWDYFTSRVLRLRDSGDELDRRLNRDVPAGVVEQLDHSAKQLDQVLSRAEPEDEPADDELDPLAARLGAGAEAARMEAIAEEASPADRDRIELVDADPIRFLQGELHELWKEAVTAMQKAPGAKAASHRPTAIGPYRLVVIPSIRGTAAGQVAIQGMANKQIELLTPTLRTSGSRNKPILAVWIYRDNSLLITHYDFKSVQRSVLWDAPRAHQTPLNDPKEAYRELAARGLQIPDQLETALSRWFRPRKKV
ncbi:MAG: serine/threonine-protein kinase [Paludisphaera borealis]|uniref:serine/threonine-protein kinase n=1 Tax=Paludisphaera borealis TaxID=1387353 RepID=UPI00283F69F0|nr:serine/threonine-protein kinase [Paludisphaera borealis]MDR3620305.1 serine/threonine-protein kinase [Paludisphaera borealis]